MRSSTDDVFSARSVDEHPANRTKVRAMTARRFMVLSPHSVANQHERGAYAVRPSDLLSFAARARDVRDRHLGDPDAAERKLRRDLRAEIEAVRLQAQIAEHGRRH